jgi:uncharacterized peroxidase-related enzyme
MPQDLQAYLAKCESKLGFVPNVLTAHAFDATKLRNFMEVYNHLMMGDSELSRLDREMIATTVSARNRCHYCLVSHGQAVRELSGDPSLGEALVMNYRVADLSAAQRAMLDFSVKLTDYPDAVDEPDRQGLRDAGFNDRTIWDIISTVSFYAMSNRLAIGTAMQPNSEYHQRSR